MRVVLSIVLGIALVCCGASFLEVQPALGGDGETSREVGQWVLSRGGTLQCLVDGKRKISIKAGGMLPAGNLDLLQIGLRSAGIADADLRRLSSFKRLNRLDLLDNAITDQGLTQLSALGELEILSLQGTKVTDAGLPQLLGLKKLQELNLFKTQITDDGLKQLARLTDLKSLNLEATLVTDAGLPNLAPLANLENLALSNTVVTDAGLVHVAKMKSLKKLAVNYTPVTDAGVAQIIKLDKLVQLNVNSSFVTDSGRSALQTALPTCKIIWNAENVRSGQPPQAVAGSSKVRISGARPTSPNSVESFLTGPVPKFLAGATVYAYNPTTRSDDPAYGRVDVAIEADTGLYLAADWADDAETPGEWTTERREYYQLLRDGWYYVGILRCKDPEFPLQMLFWKPCRQGEKLTLRTQRTIPPLVIIPAASAASPLDDEPYGSWQGRIADRVLGARWNKLLRAGRFDELEAIVAVIRRDKPFSPDGRSRLSVFYDALQPLAKAETEWREELPLFERYLAAKPSSVAAHIAFAEYWSRYAWNARGSGFGGSVTESGAESFRERSLKAREFLKKAYALTEKDPYLCRADIDLGVDLGDSPAEIEKIVDRALTIDPDYLAAPSSATRYYLPRWHGGPGDVEKFAARLADRTQGRWGDVAYTRVVLDAANFHHSSVFDHFDFSWPRVKQGFADLRKRFPSSPETAADEVRFAGYKHDREAGRAALAHFTAVRPAVMQLDSETESWLRWAADDYLAGDQEKAYDIGRQTINRVEWSLDGRRWIMLDNAAYLSVFDAADGKELSRVATHAERTRFSALIPFGKTMVTAEWDDNIVVFQVPSGRTQKLGTHEKIRAASLSTDGSEWATAGADKKIKFWNLDAKDDSPQIPEEWDMSPTTISGLAYVPNSRTIAIGGTDKRIGFWNRDTKQKSVDLTPRKGAIEFMRVSSDGSLLAVIDSKEITIWQLKEMELAVTIPHGPETFSDLVFSRDGKYLAAASGQKREPGILQVWNTRDGTPRRTFRGHKDIVRSICFSPEGDRLISVGDDMTLRVWKNE